MEPMIVVQFPDVRTLLSLILAIGAIVLFRKVRGWPALLIAIGSVAQLLMNACDAAFSYNWIPIEPPLWDRWIVKLLYNAAEAGTVCLPIGLLAFALRATRRT